jgi:hypothetical protein
MMGVYHVGAASSTDRSVIPEHAGRLLEALDPSTIPKSTGLKVPADLSAFQAAALSAPNAVGQLVTELTRSLRPYYEQAVKCYRRGDRSSLEFQFVVRSKGLVANVLGSRFVQVNSGAPVPTESIACIERALNQPFTMFADSGRLFPNDLEGELPLEIVVGAP